MSMSSPSGPLMARNASNMICAASTSSAANISSSSRSPSAGPPVNPASCQFSTILSFTAAPVALEGGIARDGPFDGANETRVARGVRWRARNGVRRRANRTRGQLEMRPNGTVIITGSAQRAEVLSIARMGRASFRMRAFSMTDNLVLSGSPHATSSTVQSFLLASSAFICLASSARSASLFARCSSSLRPASASPSPSPSASGDARPDSAKSGLTK